jgi:hypothetical protein
MRSGRRVCLTERIGEDVVASPNCGVSPPNRSLFRPRLPTGVCFRRASSPVSEPAFVTARLPTGVGFRRSLFSAHLVSSRLPTGVVFAGWSLFSLVPGSASARLPAGVCFGRLFRACSASASAAIFARIPSGRTRWDRRTRSASAEFSRLWNRSGSEREPFGRWFAA